MLRRAAGGAAALTVGYVAARVSEEQLPLEDFGAGSRAYEDQQVWRALNAADAICPAHKAVRAENATGISGLIAPALLACVSHAQPFTVIRAPSNVPNSGDGAHVSGKVPKGGVVTFYQGPVYAPVTGYIKLVLRRVISSYRIQGDDLYIIDGEDSGATTDGADGSSLMCGALCNHPPKGTTPNVLFCSTACNADVLPAASAALLRRISWYDTAPATFLGSRVQRTVVVIALRDLEDEELFVDYGFRSAEPDLPAWYHPVPRDNGVCPWERNEPFARPGFDFLKDA